MMPSVPNLPSSSFLSDSNPVSISEPKIDQTINNYHNIMLSVNCRSLVSNFELLKPIVKKCNPKIIAVSEIWRATATSSLLDNYQTPIFKTRLKRNGGGYGLYFRKDV